MSEMQIQAIKDVIKMTPRLNIECLNSIRVLMAEIPAALAPITIYLIVSPP